MHRQLRTAALTVGIMILSSSPVWAHAHLVTSEPAANATVAGPKAITLTFSEKLVPAFSKFEVTMPAMNDMAIKLNTRLSKDGKSIVGTPQGTLMKGEYKITWHAASADGHKMDGEVRFKVE